MSGSACPECADAPVAGSHVHLTDYGYVICGHEMGDVIEEIREIARRTGREERPEWLKTLDP